MGTVTSLSDSEAWDLASRARELLLSEGKRASLCVYNRQGQLLVWCVMDDTRPSTAEIARHKARQAAHTGRSTRTVRDAVRQGTYAPELLGIRREEFVPFAGGVPVYSREGVPLGGIGISALSEDEDESYCLRAVTAAGFLTGAPA